MASPIDHTLLAQLETQASDKRYDYLLQQLIATQQIWILVGNGGSVLLNSDGDDCVPIWPHQSSASAWIKDEWADCTVTAISVTDWQARWTEGLLTDGISLAAFPNLQEEALVISADAFDEDIYEALSAQ